jgi:thiol-disulfide isomerase/thioredoxin
MRILPVALLLCAAAFAGDIPRPAPNLEIELPQGRKLALHSLKGKIVVLGFISTTCGHCQQLTPILSDIQKEYGPKGVQVVTTAFNDGVSEQAVKDFIRMYKPIYPVGWNSRVAVWSFVQYSVLSQKPLYVPHLVFLDRWGNIRAEYPGEDPFHQNEPANIRKQLDSLLGAAAAKPAPAKAAPAKK